MKKRHNKWWAILFSLPIFGLFLYTQNNALTISEYSVTSTNIPRSFDGYRILQLSDLHNHSFGENQQKLVAKVNELRPDIVVLTGDLIDSRRYDEKPSLLLVEQLTKIVPVYYVTGNHEWRTGTFLEFEKRLKKAGVNVLRNETIALEQSKEQIFLHGVDDPSATPNQTPTDAIDNALSSLPLTEGYHVLLAHRPEFFSVYKKYDLDIVFSGHAHGGQIRLPFFGGLFAPGQGILPKITEGIHTKENTSIVVSRGLGNSLFPFRILNKPEIVVVTLKKDI